MSCEVEPPLILLGKQPTRSFNHAIYVHFAIRFSEFEWTCESKIGETEVRYPKNWPIIFILAAKFRAWDSTLENKHDKGRGTCIPAAWM